MESDSSENEGGETDNDKIDTEQLNNELLSQVEAPVTIVENSHRSLHTPNSHNVRQTLAVNKNKTQGSNSRQGNSRLSVQHKS